MSQGIIGDVELMTGQRTAFTTMRAVTRFTCIGLPLSVYADILRSNPRFVNRIGRELAKKLMQSDINGAITILHPLEARLCRKLASSPRKFSLLIHLTAGRIISSF